MNLWHHSAATESLQAADGKMLQTPAPRAPAFSRSPSPASSNPQRSMPCFQAFVKRTAPLSSKPLPPVPLHSRRRRSSADGTASRHLSIAAGSDAGPVVDFFLQPTTFASGTSCLSSPSAWEHGLPPAVRVGDSPETWDLPLLAPLAYVPNSTHARLHVSLAPSTQSTLAESSIPSAESCYSLDNVVDTGEEEDESHSTDRPPVDTYRATLFAPRVSVFEEKQEEQPPFLQSDAAPAISTIPSLHQPKPCARRSSWSRSPHATTLETAPRSLGMNSTNDRPVKTHSLIRALRLSDQTTLFSSSKLLHSPAPTTPSVAEERRLHTPSLQIDTDSHLLPPLEAREHSHTATDDYHTFLSDTYKSSTPSTTSPSTPATVGKHCLSYRSLISRASQPKFPASATYSRHPTSPSSSQSPRDLKLFPDPLFFSPAATSRPPPPLSTSPSNFPTLSPDQFSRSFRRHEHTISTLTTSTTANLRTKQKRLNISPTTTQRIRAALPITVPKRMRRRGTGASATSEKTSPEAPVATSSPSLRKQLSQASSSMRTPSLMGRARARSRSKSPPVISRPFSPEVDPVLGTFHHLPVLSSTATNPKLGPTYPYYTLPASPPQLHPASLSAKHLASPPVTPPAPSQTFTSASVHSPPTTPPSRAGTFSSSRSPKESPGATMRRTMSGMGNKIQVFGGNVMSAAPWAGEERKNEKRREDLKRRIRMVKGVDESELGMQVFDLGVGTAGALAASSTTHGLV